MKLPCHIFWHLVDAINVIVTIIMLFIVDFLFNFVNGLCVSRLDDDDIMSTKIHRTILLTLKLKYNTVFIEEKRYLLTQ